MLAQVDADCAQRFQIKFLHFFRWRFQDYLQLHVLEQAIRILPVSSIGRTPRRLHISHFVRIRSQHPEKGLRKPWFRADFNIVGLLQDTSPLRPKGLQSQD